MELKSIIFLCYNLDTGYCFVESSTIDRKTEINPIGYFVRFFDSLAEAYKVKFQIEKRPYLAHHYLKIP